MDLGLCKSVFRIPQDVLDDKTKSNASNRKALKYRRSHHSLAQSLEPFKAEETFNSKSLQGFFKIHIAKVVCYL